MEVQVGRRRFLKTAFAIGGGAVGTVVASATAGVVRAGDGPAPGPAELDRRYGREAGQWIASCCNACGGQCGIMVHVVEGRAVKIEPNPWNPNNYSNISTDFYEDWSPETGVRHGAAICPKGNAGLFGLYDPDRIAKPLRRTNPAKGPNEDPRWQEISWDEAITEIADRLRPLRENGHPEELLWWSEDHSFTHPQQDFCALFGTPNYSNHSNLCDVERKASFKMVMGDERPLADFVGSKYILLFGWNPTSALKWIYLARVITQALERGARMVVVDPYLSDTARRSSRTGRPASTNTPPTLPTRAPNGPRRSPPFRQGRSSASPASSPRPSPRSPTAGRAPASTPTACRVGERSRFSTPWSAPSIGRAE